MIDTTALFGPKAAEPTPSTGEAPASLDGFAAMLVQQLGADAPQLAELLEGAQLAAGPGEGAGVARILGFAERRSGEAGGTAADDDTVDIPGVAVPVADVLRLLGGDLRTGAAAGNDAQIGGASAPQPVAAAPIVHLLPPAAPDEASQPVSEPVAPPMPPGGAPPHVASVEPASFAPTAGDAATAATPAALGNPARSGDAGIETETVSTRAPSEPVVGQASPVRTPASPDPASAAPAARPPVDAAPGTETATPRDAAAQIRSAAGERAVEERSVRQQNDSRHVAMVERSPAPAMTWGGATGPATPASGFVGQLVDRIVSVVEMLHDQPPPRAFVIEVPRLDGAQIRVALRADGTLHLALAGDRPADMAMSVITAARAALEERGFDLGPDSRRRHPHRDRDDVVEAFGTGRRTTRPGPTGLRI